MAIRYLRFDIQKKLLENQGKESSVITSGSKVYELIEKLAKYLPEKGKPLIFELKDQEYE